MSRKLINTDARNPGPKALGHDPIILPEARGKIVDTVNKIGVIKTRRDPLLPFLKNPKW